MGEEGQQGWELPAQIPDLAHLWSGIIAFQSCCPLLWHVSVGSGKIHSILGRTLDWRKPLHGSFMPLWDSCAEAIFLVKKTPNNQPFPIILRDLQLWCNFRKCGTKGQAGSSGEIEGLCRAVMEHNHGLLPCNYSAGGGFFHYIHCWSLIPVSSFPGRPIPPTSSSSLLPSAQLPSSHNPPPVSCQMPLLDSNTSHQIMDTNPDEEFSPNSYLLRACSGPQQASSSGKKIANIWSLFVTCLCQFCAFFFNVQMCSCISRKLRASMEMGQRKSYWVV